MGFFDMIATKYGNVRGGKYNGLRMGLGNDSGKVFGGGVNVVVFYAGNKPVDRVSMKEIEKYEFSGNDLEITWKSGETTAVHLEKNVDYVRDSFIKFKKG